jgi:hypothetical protein
METMVQPLRRVVLICAAVVVGAALAATATAAAPSDAKMRTASSSCLDLSVALSVEESRLSYTLPENSNPAVLQPTPFAQQMIDGAGFQDFGPAFVNQLCHVPNLNVADAIVMQNGKQLWRMAVARAQQRGSVAGDLPFSDDRPLYWTRLQATAALRQWTPQFALSAEARSALITTFDRASRGMFDIDFAAGKGVKRLIMSGLDPFLLDGGPSGTAPGAAGNNVRHGNPSGAIALSVDGSRYTTADGTVVLIEAYTLPVNYAEFERGYLEETVGPFMSPGPRQANASVTMSQGGGSVFNLEMWNGRYHGFRPGNDLVAPCPSVGPLPQLAIDNHACDIAVVDRWGGPGAFDLFDPPQWTTTTLPFGAMIAANTGAGVPRPPDDGWPDTSVAFGVVWHTNYAEFPDCTSVTLVARNNPPPIDYPPPTPPIPPDPGSCSYAGGGGNYLSNESAYRNTLLRDRMGLTIPAGHVHTPDMQRFETLYEPTDATFDAWRLAISEQARKLIEVVADNTP